MRGRKTITKPAPTRKTNRKQRSFLRDETKGQIFQFFAARPGKQYGDWEAVASEVQTELGVQVTTHNLRHLRDAFAMPFTVDSDRAARNGSDQNAIRAIATLLERADARLAAIEHQLAAIAAKIDQWD